LCFLWGHARRTQGDQDESEDDAADDEDSLKFAAERLEDDEELKLFAMSNQLTWKRFPGLQQVDTTSWTTAFRRPWCFVGVGWGMYSWVGGGVYLLTFM